MQHADIGLIGLAVMGQNLVLNMHDHGFAVAVYNRTVSKVDDFVAGLPDGHRITGAHSIEELISSLKRPCSIMLMVKAGEVVDYYIEQLLPYLEEGDIIIDGGNSQHTDSTRRTVELSAKGIRFLGCGISGGEEGARHGPSIMPGGNPEAWPCVKAIYQAIAARVDGQPCCQWVGEGGAGHYVKMVHNGIEYGDMQLICEAYQLMGEGLGMDAEELHAVFAEWNQGVLDSYLIEITANIFTVLDEDGLPVLDKVLDKAGQKGTGKWTGMDALDLGVPLTLIGEAVFARCLSARKEERERAADILGDTRMSFDGDRGQVINDLEDALYASKIISYAQGYMLMSEAAKENGWDLDYGAIALMWRGGCIIRSRFLGNIDKAYRDNPGLENLLLDKFFTDAIKGAEAGWRRTVQLAVQLGIPVPTLSSALAYYDGYRSRRLPANLLQAQRDYFGAHTYERVDKPRGEFFHTDWAGTGGRVSSTSYDA